MYRRWLSCVGWRTSISVILVDQSALLLYTGHKPHPQSVQWGSCWQRRHCTVRWDQLVGRYCKCEPRWLAACQFPVTPQLAEVSPCCPDIQQRVLISSVKEALISISSEPTSRVNEDIINTCTVCVVSNFSRNSLVFVLLITLHSFCDLIQRYSVIRLVDCWSVSLWTARRNVFCKLFPKTPAFQSC